MAVPELETPRESKRRRPGRNAAFLPAANRPRKRRGKGQQDFSAGLTPTCDQLATTGIAVRRRRARTDMPTPPKPISIMAHVAGSGTAAVLAAAKS